MEQAEGVLLTFPEALAVAQLGWRGGEEPFPGDTPNTPGT